MNKLICKFTSDCGRGEWSDLKTVRGYVQRIKREFGRVQELTIMSGNTIVSFIPARFGPKGGELRVYDWRLKQWRHPFEITREHAATFCWNAATGEQIDQYKALSA